MVKTKFSWVELLAIILFLLSVYLILTRIFGQSATDLVIGVGLFTFLGVLIYNNMSQIAKLSREVGEIKVGVKNGFEKVSVDMKRLSEGMQKVKNKLKIEW